MSAEEEDLDENRFEVYCICVRGRDVSVEVM